MNALSTASKVFLKPFCLSFGIEFDMTRNNSKFVKIIFKPNIIIIKAHASAHARALEK